VWKKFKFQLPDCIKNPLGQQTPALDVNHQLQTFKSFLTCFTSLKFGSGAVIAEEDLSTNTTLTRLDKA
jgi:hypothetical protein